MTPHHSVSPGAQDLNAFIRMRTGIFNPVIYEKNNSTPGRTGIDRL
jgi:hypothetical protein